MPLNEIPGVDVLEVVSVGQPLRSGHNRPIDMYCQFDEFSSPQNYVVKLYDDLPLKRHTCARELLGSLLAIAFDLKTPKPAVINLSTDICQTVMNLDLSGRIRRSIGYNFGSKRVEKEAMIFTNASDNELQEAADVFAFDALTQNPDRRIGNPNMFKTSDGFILFDHEMAFPFSRPRDLLGGFPEAWELNLKGKGDFLTNHAVYRFIKGQPVIFEDYTEKLASMSQDVISALVSKLPDEWMSDEIENIIGYLSRARDHANLVKRCLQEVLA